MKECGEFEYKKEISFNSSLLIDAFCMFNWLVGFYFHFLRLIFILLLILCFFVFIVEILGLNASYANAFLRIFIILFGWSGWWCCARRLPSKLHSAIWPIRCCVYWAVCCYRSASITKRCAWCTGHYRIFTIIGAIIIVTIVIVARVDGGGISRTTGNLCFTSAARVCIICCCACICFIHTWITNIGQCGYCCSRCCAYRCTIARWNIRFWH